MKDILIQCPWVYAGIAARVYSSKHTELYSDNMLCSKYPGYSFLQINSGTYRVKEVKKATLSTAPSFAKNPCCTQRNERVYSVRDVPLVLKPLLKTKASKWLLC